MPRVVEYTVPAPSPEEHAALMSIYGLVSTPPVDARSSTRSQREHGERETTVQSRIPRLDGQGASSLEDLRNRPSSDRSAAGTTLRTHRYRLPTFMTHRDIVTLVRGSVGGATAVSLDSRARPYGRHQRPRTRPFLTCHLTRHPKSRRS